MCLVDQGITLGECETQLELLDDIVTDATTAEILFADSLSVHVVIQDIMEILTCPLVDNEHRLTVGLLSLLLVRELTLLYLDIIFLRQPTQSLRIGDLLMLHEEVDGIPPSPQAKQ